MESYAKTERADKATEGQSRGQAENGGQDITYVEPDASYTANFGRSLDSQAAMLRSLPRPHRQTIMRKISQSQGNQHVLRLISKINLTTSSRRSVVQRCDHSESTVEDDAEVTPPTGDFTLDALAEAIVHDPVISRRMIYRSDDGAHATDVLLHHSNLPNIYRTLRTGTSAGSTSGPQQMHFCFMYEPISGAEGRRVREVEISLPGVVSTGGGSTTGTEGTTAAACPPGTMAQRH